MIKQDNAIFMEPAEYEEYRKQQEEMLTQMRIENPEKITDVSLYQLNQGIITQMKDLTFTEIKKRMKLIRSWFYHNPAKYYALICWDYNYITIFHFPNDNYDEQVRELQENLLALGPIKAIDPHGEGQIIEMHQIEDHIEDIDAFEIWVTWDEKDGPKLFMLFPYDKGVIEI